MFAPWKKSYDQPRQHIKKQRHYFANKGPSSEHLVKATVFPVVMYGCESWTIKKAEHQIIDAFELWCWRRLLRAPVAHLEFPCADGLILRCAGKAGTPFHASPRGEALFRCARPSGVPRGPATSTGSLASQRHPGKLTKVPGSRRGKRGFPAAPRERPRESFFNASRGPSPLP